jgi:hypothetical protein
MDTTCVSRSKAFSVRRIAVPPEPLLPDAAYDYADAFEVTLSEPDDHPAETWVRTALEASPAALRRLIGIVHGRVIRFRLGPTSDPQHIIGWRIVTSEPDVVCIEAVGPILRAAISARRTSPRAAVLTTFLWYAHPRARLLWLVVGPLHRRVAPYLLRRAAESLTTSRPPGAVTSAAQ